MPFDTHPDAGAAGHGMAGRFGVKYGPLPLWGWMAALLGVALAYSMYKSRKASSKTQTDQTSADATSGIGGNQLPPVVFQDYDTIITGPGVPPGGGREHPPSGAPVPTPAPGPGTPGGVHIEPIQPVTSPKGPPPAGVPAPASPAGDWVTVAKWTATNTAWNSTLWGIANHFGYGAGSSNWQSIWSAPENAGLKSRRKDPTKIQPGDRIFVPKKK